MAKPVSRSEGNAKLDRDETKALHKYRGPYEKRATNQARRRALAERLRRASE